MHVGMFLQEIFLRISDFGYLLAVLANNMDILVVIFTLRLVFSFYSLTLFWYIQSKTDCAEVRDLYLTLYLHLRLVASKV